MLLPELQVNSLMTPPNFSEIAFQKAFDRFTEFDTYKYIQPITFLSSLVISGLIHRKTPFDCKKKIKLIIKSTSKINLGLLSFTFGSFYHGEFSSEKFKQSHRIDQVYNKKVVLVLQAKDDYNRTFKLDQGMIKDFEKFKKSHSIIFQEVCSIADINSAIKEVKLQKNHIMTLWIRAHGSPTAIHLSQDHGIYLRNYKRLDFSSLDEHSNIILESCTQDNIATAIKAQAGEKRVFSSPISFRQIRIINQDPLELKFSNCPVTWPLRR